MFCICFQNWSVHDVGAMTAFISGLSYCWLQCAMSYKLRDHGVINSSAVCHSRAMLSLILSFCVMIFGACQGKANLEWDRVRPRYHFLAKLKWSPQDPGYLYHVISSVAEWSMCGGMLLFMLTFAQEFQQIEITSDISSTDYWKWLDLNTTHGFLSLQSRRTHDACSRLYLDMNWIVHVHWIANKQEF